MNTLSKSFLRLLAAPRPATQKNTEGSPATIEILMLSSECINNKFFGSHCSCTWLLSPREEISVLYSDMFPSTIVDLVQLSPRRSFDLAKALNELGVLRSITTDCAFSSRSLTILSSLPFFKKVRLDQYNSTSIAISRLFVVYPAKLLLLIAGLFKPVSLFRLLFYLSAQTLVQAAFIANDLFQFIKNPKQKIVFCFDTGAFLVIAYKLLLRKSFLVYIEQCVSPRAFQLEALKKYSVTKIAWTTRAYFEFMSIVERFEYKHANLLVCPSSIVYQQLIKLGIPSAHVCLIPYSFEPELEYFNPSSEKKQNSSILTKILFVGNDFQRKGLSTLLDSLELLQAYDFEVHLAGNFSLEDLKREIDHPLINRLILHGKLNKKSLYNLYQSSSVFISPSFCEGSPMTILEAASFDNLIIASVESGCNLKPYIEYLPFNAGNYNELACHLKDFMDNPSLFNDMILCSRKALDRFSPQAYRSLLAESLITLIR